MDDLTVIGLISAFLGGIISFLSPCVLPLVPGYISYIAGGTLEDLTTSNNQSRKRLAALVLSVFFICGFTIVFIGLGASASAVGDFLQRHKTEFEYAAGSVIGIFGLYLTGLLRVPFLSRELRFISRFKGGHPLSATLLGMAFAFGWTPCIGPQLGAILSLAASEASIARGTILLAVYALGLGLPFLLVAAFLSKLTVTLGWMKRYMQQIEGIMGLLLWTIGLLMLTGGFSDLSYWLLERFPALGALG